MPGVLGLVRQRVTDRLRQAHPPSLGHDRRGRHADLLSNFLYPNKTLQEREIAGLSYVSRYGPDLLRGLYESIHPDCLDHQVITL